MKKIFTLFAIAFCAISTNAQGTYTYAVGDTPGTDVTTVTGITLSYSAEGAWAAAAAQTNYADADFANYTKGNNVSGKFTEGSAPTGCWYKFASTVAGTLTVGITLNAGKPFFVVKGSNFSALPIADLTPNLPSAAGGASQAFDATTNQIAAKSYGTVSFAVTANETYYVLCTGSKLGFYGFKFVTSDSPSKDPASVKNISAEKSASENANTYNLAGQQVSKTQKGLVIKNGKKIINM